MRTTLTIEDALIERASKLTGIQEKTALVLDKRGKNGNSGDIPNSANSNSGDTIPNSIPETPYLMHNSYSSLQRVIMYGVSRTGH